MKKAQLEEKKETLAATMVEARATAGSRADRRAEGNGGLGERAVGGKSSAI
jgi:hypothetical protein